MNQLSPAPNLHSNPIKERLIALLQAVLLDNNLLEDLVKQSDFKSHFKPVILSLVKQLPGMIVPMLDNLSEDDLRRGLTQIRDEFLPFLLNEYPKIIMMEPACDCMTYQIPGPHHHKDCPMFEARKDEDPSESG